MSHQSFKTPRNVFVDSEKKPRKSGTFTLSEDNVGVQTRQRSNATEQIVRRSPRKGSKDYVDSTSKKTSHLAYPGSSTKPKTKRSFITPVQTFPAKDKYGPFRRSANLTYSAMSDMDDIITPRSNIAAFLAVANSESKITKSPSEVTKKPMTRSMNRFLETQEQEPQATRKKSSISVIDILTPSSKLTPRTNICEFLQHANSQEETPVAATSVGPKQQAVKSTRSAIKHQHLGQEVTLSPMYLNSTSEEGDDQLSTTATSFRRNKRKSFRLPSAVTHNDRALNISTHGKSTEANTQSQLLAIGSKHWGQEVNLSPTPLTDTSVNEDSPSPSKKSSQRNRKSFHIPISQRSAQESNEPIIYQWKATLDEIESVERFLKSLPMTAIDQEDNVHNAMSDYVNVSVNIDLNAGDKAAEGNNKVHIDNMADVNKEADINNETINSQTSTDNILHPPGQRGLTKNILYSNEAEVIENMSQSNEFNRDFDEVNNKNAAEKSRSSKEINAILLDKNDLAPKTMQVTSDANVDDHSDEGIRAQGVENLEDNNDELQKDSVKDKSQRESRPHFTSKHGEISFLTSPKNINNKSADMAPNPNASVFDLSFSSNSDNVELPRYRHSLSNLTKRSSTKTQSVIIKDRSTTTNIIGQSLLSAKRSKPSYSQWKSLQKDADNSRSSTSFLHVPLRLSSTPIDRTKKIFHSTRIHNSMTTQGLDEPESFINASSNISPIRLEGEDHEQGGQLIARHELTNTTADKGRGRIDFENRDVRLTQTENREMDKEVESGDDDALGLSPLRTPKIDMNKKKQILSVGFKSKQTQLRKENSGPQKRKKEQPKTGKQAAKRVKKNTALSHAAVKFFAERHTTMKLSKDSIEEIEAVSEQFWENTFSSLEAYAVHAGRKVINEQDVVLLMKRQKLVKNTEELYDLIRKYLPMELRSELIPMALP